MSVPQNKKEAFRRLLDGFSEVLSNNGCNDFEVANTPEMLLELEKAEAINQNMTLEEFRTWINYDDYRPYIAKDGKSIYTTDYAILSLIESELKGLGSL